MMMMIMMMICIQDKYILGLMVMLCGVCVWHAIVGAAAGHYHMTNDHVTSPEMTSWPDITSQEMTTPSAMNATSAELTICSTLVDNFDSATVKVATIKMADKMALVMFGSLYLLFHVVFVARICMSVSFQLVLFIYLFI